MTWLVSTKRSDPCGSKCGWRDTSYYQGFWLVSHCLLVAFWAPQSSTSAHAASVNRTEKGRGGAQEGSERIYTILRGDPHDPHDQRPAENILPPFSTGLCRPTQNSGPAVGTWHCMCGGRPTVPQVELRSKRTTDESLGEQWNITINKTAGRSSLLEAIRRDWKGQEGTEHRIKVWKLQCPWETITLSLIYQEQKWGRNRAHPNTLLWRRRKGQRSSAPPDTCGLESYPTTGTLRKTAASWCLVFFIWKMKMSPSITGDWHR